MKAFAIALGALATCGMASHSYADGKVTVKGDHGACVLSSFDGSTLSGRQIDASCVALEKANIVRQSGSGYQLTDLALAMGPGIWQAIEADLPKGPAAPPPAYYLTVDVLGVTHRYPVTPKQPIDVTSSVHFAYLGECLTRADFASIRDSVLLGGSVEQASETVNTAAAARAPHSLAADERPTLQSDSWDYSIAVQPSDIGPDGNVTLTISGTSSGPTNYDSAAAAQCNGYRPTIASLPIPEAALSVHNEAVLQTALLGDVRFHVSTLQDGVGQQ